MICVGHTELVKSSSSPIQTTYDYVKKLDPGTNVVLVLGKKDIDDGRYAGVGKDREDINVSMYAVKFGGISGTKMRNFAKDGDAVNFMKNLPAKFNNDERKEMYEMVKSNVLSETPQSSVIAKGSKDPVRINIGRSALYNLVEDLYNEVAPELGNAPQDYNPLYAEETFKFIFDKSIPEETKDKFLDLAEEDPRAAIKFLMNYKNETNEVSSVVGGSVEGYAGPFTGKKKKKKTN